MFQVSNSCIYSAWLLQLLASLYGSLTLCFGFLLWRLRLYISSTICLITCTSSSLLCPTKRVKNLVLQNLAETTVKELQLQLHQTEKAAMSQQQQLADKDGQLKSVKQDLQHSTRPHTTPHAACKSIMHLRGPRSRTACCRDVPRHLDSRT